MFGRLETTSRLTKYPRIFKRCEFLSMDGTAEILTWLFCYFIKPTVWVHLVSRAGDNFYSRGRAQGRSLERNTGEVREGSLDMYTGHFRYCLSSSGRHLGESRWSESVIRALMQSVHKAKLQQSIGLHPAVCGCAKLILHDQTIELIGSICFFSRYNILKSATGI